MQLDQKQLTLFVVGLFLGVALGALGVALQGRTRPAPLVIVPPEPTAAPQPTATDGPIQVYISGAVKNPAVYSLPPGSIMQALVEAAGGFSDEADPARINLAQPLVDGMHVHAPLPGEEGPPLVVAAETAASADTVAGGGAININSASVEQLDSLSGIGPSTAQKIIDYREENGPFAAIEDIMNVPGIGEAKFGEIEAKITVD